MNKFSHKKYSKALAGKIITTCLLACVAIFLLLYISRFTFSKILSTVDQLSKPDTKIQLVNGLFRDVVKLDHLQRNQALKTDRTTYNPFLKESKHIQEMLDSLRGMSLQSQGQVARIDSMKKILYKRDLLFLRYIKLRTALVRNDTLADQVKNLSEMIEKARVAMDSNLITTSKAIRTTIDTLKEDEEKISLWKRIFSKRKPLVKQVQRQIEEELKVRVDTVGLGNKGDSLAKIGQAISEVETNRLSRRTQLRGRQAELNYTGDILVAELISILNDIEHDELAHGAGQNAMAIDVVNKGIIKISGVLIIFIVGIALLIFLIFADISRSNEYRKQLITAKEKAEQAELVKQRFLANMSHELRTPLQTIIGLSEQIRTISHPRSRDLENIYQSSLHLLQIVNEVLDYSRIISGKYAIENKPFNMYGLLADVREMIQVQLALKKLTLDYDISISADNYYSGDAFRLKQVLLNLFGNAVKFTNQGGVSLSVTEHEQAGGVSLFTFMIKDTGIGISAADMAVIFNEFEQGGDSYKKQGTGLGLNIVKAMVELQQGTINVKSEPGEGTTFTFTLPYIQAEAITDAPYVQPAITNNKGHIWVVDDDLFILQLCDSILTKYGITHTCFSSPKEVLVTEFPDGLTIIFMDIRMAEMDGIMLCSKLRERPVSNPPEYIALTAQAFADEQAAILQKGFDGLVVKPFLEQDLINAIARHTVIDDGQQLSLDLSAIHKMTEDDKDMLYRVLQSFITETEIDITAAKDSIEHNDGHELAEILHKLASRCGQLGAISLAHRLRSIELTLLEHKNIDAAAAKMDAIYPDLTAIVAVAKELLSNSNITT